MAVPGLTITRLTTEHIDALSGGYELDLVVAEYDRGSGTDRGAKVFHEFVVSGNEESLEGTIIRAPAAEELDPQLSPRYEFTAQDDLKAR